MVKTVTYKPAHREDILALLDDVPFKRNIWEWQFEDPAITAGFNPVVLVDDRERVVAFNGVMPAPIKYGDQLVDGLWSCDFYVSEAYRGTGLGRQVKDALMERAPVVMSFGVSPRAVMVLEHLGWRENREAFSYRVQSGVRSLRDLALVLLQGTNRLRGAFKSSVQDTDLAWHSSLPPSGEVDGLWTRVAAGYRKIVRRDHAYLDWKYQRHPLATYDFLIARSTKGQLEAVLVVRADGRSMRIVDWLGPARAPALKRAMVRESRRRFPEIRHFSATTSDSELGQAFCDAGFFRARTRPSFYVRSRLEGDERCEEGWFLMAGDSDGELLLAARENFTRGDGQ